MTTERFTPETSPTNQLAAQPGAKAGLVEVQSSKSEVEKRNRRRKKSRRKNRAETVDGSAVVSRKIMANSSPVEGDTIVVWQRPEDSAVKQVERRERQSQAPGSTPETQLLVEAHQTAEKIPKSVSLERSAEPNHETPMPPPLPPDPVSYRRRFWEDVDSDTGSDNREALPQIHEYERPKRAYTPPSEAEPMHSYAPHQLSQSGEDSSRKSVKPVSAEVQAVAETGPAAQSERRLDKQEILNLAKDITVDGVKLKDIYDSNRIDEAGLRAVIEVYLKGGDVKPQLTREIIAKEQSYERDPQLRHQRPPSKNTTMLRGSAAGRVIGKALGQAKVIAGDTRAKLSVSSQRTATSASKFLANGAKQAQHDLIDNSSTMDWISITAVVVLYSIILILLLG